jgi:hypothetical protein
LKGFDQFIKVFGDITVLNVVEFVLAVIFIIYIWRITKKHINAQHDAEQKRDAELKEALNGVRMYPKYREQSIEIQQQLESKFDVVHEMCMDIIERLDKMEEARRNSKRKELQASLLQSYRLFTDPVKNPVQAWTEMEANAFWEQFSEYEENGGNGHMHTVVQPAMNKLTVVKMSEHEKLYELMHNRKL